MCRNCAFRIRYLANLLTAGEEYPVRFALERLLAMRAYMRSRHVDGRENLEVLEQVNLDRATVEDMYKILALAAYEDRFVIPTTHREYAENAYDLKSACGFSFGNGCSGGDSGLFGRAKHSHGVQAPTDAKVGF